MVPPRRFSNISDSGDISHTTSCSKRQRINKSHKNDHFDRMMQSMSAAASKDRRQHKASYDAYSPSRSTTLASELSFIKRTDTRRSSSASKVFPEHTGANTTKIDHFLRRPPKLHPRILAIPFLNGWSTHS